MKRVRIEIELTQPELDKLVALGRKRGVTGTDLKAAQEAIRGFARACQPEPMGHWKAAAPQKESV